MMRFTLITLISVSLAAAQAPPAATPPAAAPPKPQRVQPPARISGFRAQPATIQPGQSTTLSWAAENPNASTISPDIGRVTPRGSRQVTPKATTTYVLTVTGPNNTVLTKEVTVTVPGTTPVISAAAGDVKKEVPRLANGKPDLSGVYGAGGGGGRGAGTPVAGAGGGRGAAPAGPELKAGMEKYKVVRGPNDAGALSDCMPIAGPAAYTVPYQFQILQNPNYAVIMHEYPGVFRIVPTNGSIHPVDPDPTWMGDAIGRWDGDTLVVDMVGFNTKTELSGFKHSEGLHIVERFSRPDFDTLQYEATLEDPDVFVRPWTISRTFSLRHDLNKIDEFVCENNRDYGKFFEKK